MRLKKATANFLVNLVIQRINKGRIAEEQVND